MKPKKGKASASKQAKQPLKTTKKTSQATTKQNTCKRQASDDSDDADSDDDRPKRKRQNKNRLVEDVDEEESGATDPEVIVESDDEVQLGVEPEDNDEVSKSSNSYQNTQLTMEKNDDELEDRHQLDIPIELRVKKDTTKDLLTIFSARVTVNFKKGNNSETITGRWCMLCKYVECYGKRKTKLNAYTIFFFQNRP